MKVIIVGAGEVGYHIADRLSKEGHQVVVIDQDLHREKQVEEKINALVVHGNGASAKTLEEVGIKSARLFIAVTDVDEVNLIACLIARQYDVPFIVSRVKDFEYIDSDHVLNSKSLGIDMLINPQHVVSDEICRMVNYMGATEAAEFADGEILFISFQLNEGTPVVGIPIKDLRKKDPGFNYIIAAVTRKDKTIIPKGDDHLTQGDIISFVCRREDLPRIHKLLGLKLTAAKTVFILGGGRIGQEVARKLSDGKHIIKVIDHNPEHCRELSEQLDDVLVLNSDNNDVETLKNEGIANADAYVAITNDDAANILGALLARKYGAKRTIALVNEPELVNLANNLGVEACISPRLATAGAILKYIRGEKVFKIAMLEQNGAEVIEFEISESFKELRMPLKKTHVPSGVIVGAIRRGSETIIPTGDDYLDIGDHAIVFCLNKTIGQAEKYFA